MVFKGLRPRESDDEATARLASAPVGSINHELSQLPVRFRDYPPGHVLLLPRTGLVVVPTRNCGKGSWGCAVVAGNGRYPVGGYDLFISRDEIRRAVPISQDALRAAAGSAVGVHSHP